ncbi:MAG TPA: cellulase family glycosylhydrolase [Streptosporangiaceae bacterium]|nr:cellulase family glycosylhydrolase [Streptosporangiaceae bacterium]
MDRDSALIAGQDGPVTWLGANFWSRTGGPLMWRSYDPATVREELAVLRAHGLNMTRSFFYWPDFMPAADLIDEAMADRFADFLDRHAEAGLRTVPTFIVGHMSGQNWDPPWRGDRDLYGDVWMVGRQAWFAGEMVRRFGTHPAVAGWLISNEMPLYGGRPASRDVVSAWAQIMRDAVRAAGGWQPLSLGDGAWGTGGTTAEGGFSLAEVARLCDFLGPHVYPVGDDEVRQHYAAAWECELAGTYGKTVVLEEFGVSSDFAAGPAAARYYRQVLHNSLLAGATGWIAWCNSDYDALAGQDPYRHHAFELHFGLTDAAGQPKPQLAEVKAFAATLRAVDIARCQRAPADAVLVVPAYLDTAYPFTSPQDGAYIHQTLRQAYVSARLADVPVALARESDGIGDDGRLYLAPSVKQLLAPTLTGLERLAEGGATVYVSYSAGPSGWHRGPSYGRLNDIFGVDHQLRAGLADPIEDEVVTFTMRRALGSLPGGATLRFRAAGNEHSRSYLPVRPDGAEVLATDGHGRPALLLRRVGAGSLVLCTYPIEHMAAVTPRVNPEATGSLYDALADHAGVRRAVVVRDPRVAADVLVRSDGQRFAWLVSQADTAVTVTPELADGLALAALEAAGQASCDRGTVTLPPYGAGVFVLVSATR